MNDESDFVLIGRLRRAHGINGEVCVEPISSVVERFKVLKSVLVKTKEGTTEIGVDSVRMRGGLILLKLHGLDDRSSAQALSGAMLGVRKHDVYPLPKDTYYVFDVIGSEVIGESGKRIGTVEDVLSMPANDVFVLETGKGEVLIPAARSVIKKFDPEKKVIVIKELEGLLD